MPRGDPTDAPLRAPGNDGCVTATPATPRVSFREVRPDDDDAALDVLLSELDAQSRYSRWFSGAVDMHRAADWAAHPERQQALGLVAIAGEVIVGHAVLVPAGEHTAEVAFEVAAEWRHQGIAGHLLDALIQAGRERGVDTLVAEVLAENSEMLAVFREHGGVCERLDATVTSMRLEVDTSGRPGSNGDLPLVGATNRGAPYSGLEDPRPRRTDVRSRCVSFVAKGQA
jgi:GNAT superfamily N-acetyltransferase